MKKLAYTLLWIAMIAVAAGSLLSLLVNTDNRYLKFLDFPRIQFFWAGLGVFVVFLLANRRWAWYDYLIAFGLVAGVIVQSTYLANYTPLVSVAVPDAPAELAEIDRVSVLVLNVLEENRDSAAVRAVLGERDPDLFIGMEVNPWWDRALDAVQAGFPYSEEVVNDRGYGMVVYSRLPLSEVRVEYLNNEDVPTIGAVAALEDGRRFRLIATHPVPPTYFEKLPDNKGQREVALSEIGKRVRDVDLPVLVAGDLNDVAWGNTDRLTETEGALADVRVGRGFFNSFDATNPLMRWPLDHALVTEEWSVVGIERLRDVGSDHYPVYFELALAE